MKSKTLKILLIEDNEAEVYQVLDAIKSHNNNHQVEVFRDGVNVISFLEERKSSFGNNYPDLVVLDLNLPQHNGRKLISEIKSHRALKSTPIVVLTSSDHEADIKNSYREKISSYIVKPSEYEEFVKAIYSALDFYSISQMPTNNYER